MSRRGRKRFTRDSAYTIVYESVQLLYAPWARVCWRSFGTCTCSCTCHTCHAHAHVQHAHVHVHVHVQGVITPASRVRGFTLPRNRRGTDAVAGVRAAGERRRRLTQLSVRKKTNSPHANARRLNASHHPNPALYTTTRDSLAYRTRRSAPAYFRQHTARLYNQRRDRYIYTRVSTPLVFCTNKSLRNVRGGPVLLTRPLAHNGPQTHS